jgi:hypothetical protein
MNLIEQAINCNDGDRAAKIIRDALGIDSDDVANYCFPKEWPANHEHHRRLATDRSAVPGTALRLGAVNMDETTPKTQAQFLRDAFEGIKGRQPTSDDELNQWLATDEGKAATMFDDTTLSPWGDRGRS